MDKVVVVVDECSRERLREGKGRRKAAVGGS